MAALATLPCLESHCRQCLGLRGRGRLGRSRCSLQPALPGPGEDERLVRHFPEWFLTEPPSRGQERHHAPTMKIRKLQPSARHQLPSEDLPGALHQGSRMTWPWGALGPAD